MLTWIKKNPARAFTVLILALGIFDGATAKAGLLSGTVLAWLGVAEAVGVGVGGLFGLHNAVTPVADPKAADGTPLVPAP